MKKVENISTYEEDGIKPIKRELEQYRKEAATAALKLAKKENLSNDESLKLHDYTNKLCDKSELTDDECVFLGEVSKRGGYEWLVLQVEKLTDNQAKELGKIKMLSFHKLTSITDKQAENLSKVKFLDINRKILTPKQREILKK